MNSSCLINFLRYSSRFVPLIGPSISVVTSFLISSAVMGFGTSFYAACFCFLISVLLRLVAVGHCYGADFLRVPM